MGKTTRKPQITHRQFVEIIQNETHGEYEVLSEYRNTRTPVKILHKTCGRMWDCNTREFRKGTRCPYCSGLRLKTHEEFLTEVKELAGDEYIVLSNYVNGHTKMTFRHNSKNCQYHTFEKTPNKFLHRSHICPVCLRRKKESKLSKMVELILKSIGVRYEREVSFEGCKLKMHLSFDFYVEDPETLIECDGMQHERAWYGSEEKLTKQQERDRIKDVFAKKSNVPLIRIKHSQKREEVEKILREALVGRC